MVVHRESLELARVPIFPLPNVVLFPGALLPLHVFEPRYRELTRDALAGDRRLLVPRLQPGFEAEYHARPPIHAVCGLGEIIEHERRADGRYDIVLTGLARVRVEEELPGTHAYRCVRAALLADHESDLAALGALRHEVVTWWGRLAPYLPLGVRDLCDRRSPDETSGAFADRLAAALISDPDDRQHFLEELDVGERICRLLARVRELHAALSSGGDFGSRSN